MARRKDKAEIAPSRPERRGPPGPSPLIVLAGLPKATAVPAAATINNDPSSRWRAIAAAFSAKDGAIYDDAAAAIELARLTCELALAGVRDEQGVPKPSRIVVAYVAEGGSAQLWDVFGHAVWPVALRHPDWQWPKGRHWRNDIETVNLLLRRAIRELESAAEDDIRLRLEAHRSDDILLLPGRNFHVGAERLVDRFRLFMNNGLDIPGIEAGIKVERFAFERLAAFYSRVGGRNKPFAVDARDIVFAKSNNGQHGGRHEIADDGEIDPGLLQRILEGRYRFGTPLEPAGFQHDAQFEGGVHFDGEWFDCVTKGPTQFSTDHVNIYPSDVVTG